MFAFEVVIYGLHGEVIHNSYFKCLIYCVCVSHNCQSIKCGFMFVSVFVQLLRFQLKCINDVLMF